MALLYPSNLTDNHLNTLPISEHSWVVTQWEAEASTAGGFLLDTRHLTEVNKDYEHWLGTLPDEGLQTSNEVYQHLAEKCARAQGDEHRLYVDGKKFFQDNDTHPYQDYIKWFQMMTHTTPVFEEPPFHRPYTQHSWDIQSTLGELSPEVHHGVLSSAVGVEGCHLRWISEKAGVDWIWMDFTEANQNPVFHIWGQEANIPVAHRLLEEHLDHQMTERFHAYSLLESCLGDQIRYGLALQELFPILIGKQWRHFNFIKERAGLTRISMAIPESLDEDVPAIILMGSPKSVRDAKALVSRHCQHVLSKYQNNMGAAGERQLEREQELGGGAAM